MGSRKRKRTDEGALEIPDSLSMHAHLFLPDLLALTDRLQHSPPAPVERTPLAEALVGVLYDNLRQRRSYYKLPTNLIKKILMYLDARECWRIATHLSREYRNWVKQAIDRYRLRIKAFDSSHFNRKYQQRIEKTKTHLFWKAHYKSYRGRITFEIANPTPITYGKYYGHNYRVDVWESGKGEMYSQRRSRAIPNMLEPVQRTFECKKTGKVIEMWIKHDDILTEISFKFVNLK